MGISKKSLRRVSNIFNNNTFFSESPAETKKLGREFSSNLCPGDVVYLKGDLGSGKTTFVQGLANGLGIKEFIRSSSFVLVNQYVSSRVKLYHMDLYRLEGVELEEIGIEEYILGDGICIVEWADKIKDINAILCYQVSIRWLDERKREIKFEKRKRGSLKG